MKVLVVGSGGREHALAWAIQRSPRVREVHLAPGNGGTHGVGVNVPIAAEDISALTAYAREQRFDLTVVGPEVPLVLGLADALQAEGLRVFGPSAGAAQLEGSKAFCKDLMRANGIPTADYSVFTDYAQTLAYLDQHPAPIVVKADGLAAGKGAVVCQSDAEAREALRQMMQERVFGAAGERVVIEECLAGQEVSLLAFCDGRIAVPMVQAQDHKAVFEGDRGPNTGGMGCYAPARLLDEKLVVRVTAEVLQPTVDAMRRAGRPYVGVLYAGLMVQGDDYQVLEFNCRFGDPEAQVILPLLETDLLDVLDACIDGHLDQVALRWADKACVCVVMASGGYPGHYEKGQPIQGLEQAAACPDTLVFHAGTRLDGERVLTAGGRVLGVTAWADDLPLAIERAYAAVDRISWPGAQFRRDIGAKGLAAGKGTA
ncbi:MAG: phosphoribosylamine--glycine ligase [Anaerolineae bacterium]